MNEFPEYEDCPATLRSPDSQDRIEEDQRQEFLNRLIQRLENEHPLFVSCLCEVMP